MSGFLGLTYPWVKAAHLVFVLFWMAGLFMLPRFLVYHQEAAPGQEKAPPVMILVCDNTDIAQVFFENISGERQDDAVDGEQDGDHEGDEHDTDPGRGVAQLVARLRALALEQGLQVGGAGAERQGQPRQDEPGERGRVQALPELEGEVA